MSVGAREAIKFIYRSYVLAQPHIEPGLLDVYKRRPGYSRLLLQQLGLDLAQPPSVLITGSKGKGSTSAFIAALLQAARYRVGLFTGPHLVDFCERVRFNGQKIPEAEFVALVDTIKPVVDKIQATLPPDHYLGPVGTILAAALLWYDRQGADFRVLECGRGALADDVNVIANRWSVLTPIMFEHAQQLGPTLLDIAANKLAVLKKGQQLCVSCRQPPEATKLLKSLSRVVGVPLKLEGEHYFCEALTTGLAGGTFAYKSPQREHVFTIPLAGRFQAANAAAALSLVEEIAPGIDNDTVQAGLATVRWPGRCQLVAGQPPLILDGAINAQSAEYLQELLAARSEPLYLVMAAPVDKDWQGVLTVLAPGAAAVWLTEAKNNSLVFPPREQTLAAAAKLNPRSYLEPDCDKAMAAAVAAAAKNGGSVVVAGTLSLLRDAKIYIQQQLGREADE